MKTITISGASDDLIELEGDIREEYSPHDDEGPNLLAFSDGTVIGVKYADDGCWRLNRLQKGTADYSKKEADGPDTDNYTDRVTLKGDLKWCVLGSNMAKVS